LGLGPSMETGLLHWWPGHLGFGLRLGRAAGARG